MKKSFQILHFLLFALSVTRPALSASTPPQPSSGNTGTSNSQHHQVLILGGGVAGVIAARTLHQNGIDDFVIVDARPELGGRMQTFPFGKIGNKNFIIEQGPNWIQGTQTGNGPANPIFTLAKKHKLKSQLNDFDSMTTYDSTGHVDFLDALDQAEDNLDTLTVIGGERVDATLVDVSARTGYSLFGAKPNNTRARVTEYFEFDWEYAQTPEQSSLIASSWNNNFTFDPDMGGFSDDNLLSIDQRGFKFIIQAEAQEFLKPQQMMLNSTVKTVSYSNNGVSVVLSDGRTVSADFAICTFSLGVLQNDDVAFSPVLPAFKQEAIQSMIMATYTKIFFQFPSNFWFNTEMALFADSERGRYPVWQSLDHPNFMPGSGILFVTVTGDYSVRVEGLPDSQVKAEAMGVLRSMFPNITIPEPTDFFFPRWHSNPLFRGSYSNWPPSFTSQHLDNFRANVGRLYFAGEATSRKYYGFLHGAYFEGMNAAQVLASCIKNSTCPPLESFAQVTNGFPYENN